MKNTIDIKTTHESINNGKPVLTSLKKYPSPLRLIIIISASIFLIEALIMFILSVLPPLPQVFKALFDSFLLILFLSPMIYFFIWKPLILYSSECKQAEDVLRKHKASLDEAQRIARLGSWDWNIVKNELFWSDEIYRIFGLKAEEVDASHEVFYKHVHSDDRAFVRETVNEALKNKMPFKINYRIIRPDGAEHFIYEQAEVKNDKTGQPIRIVGTLHNITEQKKREEELLKIQKLESVGLLAGGIAHDFNNLLTIIRGNISMARMFSGQDEKFTERLEEAETASLRARDLTKQLLTFSKGGAPVKIPFYLNNLLKDSSILALRGSNVKCDFLIPDSPLIVEADEGQLVQAFNNIIINAAQAMPEGGTIKIQCNNITIAHNDGLPLQDGDYVKVSISDEGAGIPKKHIKKIFDPYYTTKQKGSGLGLTICYSIIKNHRGHINVESKVRAGTTFHIYLPISKKEVLKKKEVEVKSISSKSLGRILVMDDEEKIRTLATGMLTSMGYAVECAKEGASAIDLYKKSKKAGRHFDVVLLDLTIPGGMGGKEVMKELVRFDPNVRAIVSSGYSNDPIMSEYRKYGFSGVLAKPFDVKELNTVLQKVTKGGTGQTKDIA